MDPVRGGGDPSGHDGPTTRVAHETFDRLTDVVVCLDENFEITYVNEFALELLKYDRADIIGHSVAEFLNAEDIVRAFEVVDLVQRDDAKVPVTPALYDLRRADGSWMPIALNAVAPPPGSPLGATVVFGRYSGDHLLQNRILELITAGSPDVDLIAILPEFGRWRHPEEQYAVVYADSDGSLRRTGTDLAVALIDGDDEPDSPWARVRRDHTEIMVDPDDLPPGLRQAASAADLGACWAVPVTDPLHDAPAVLVAWSRRDGPSPAVHRFVLEIMGRMLSLILQWRQQQVDLERAARHDPLTQVANRAGFFEVLEVALAAADHDAPVGVLYIDLDGFKGVNDQHGHSVGDEVLREVATRLAGSVRAGDLIARLGGDEFAVVCPAISDVADVTQLARRIIDTLSEPISIRGHRITIGASVGIAASVGTILPDLLVDAADRSLYQAKSEGRGRWHLARRASDGIPLLP